MDNPKETEPSALADLITSPFMVSFIGAARPAEHRVADQSERTAGWAARAVSSIRIMSGYQDRSYPALTLTGAFYDPKGTGTAIQPHLEIPDWRVGVPAEDFPTRLALAGNGLDFPYWVKDEVLALRRGLFNNPTTDIRPVADLLFAHSDQLGEALEKVLNHASKSWRQIEALLVDADDTLCESVCGDFTTEDVAAFFPAGKDMHLSISFDAKLAERNGNWATRRVGVWTVSGVDADGDRFSFGVVTPRLTSNSQFKDPLFDKALESRARLLERALMVPRVGSRHTTNADVTVKDADDGTPITTAHFRTIAAKVGHKLPEASMLSVVNFLQAYYAPGDAWKALEAFAERTGMLLTVTEPGFTKAFQRAARFLARNEGIDRDDINVVLPLGWRETKVLRVSFSRDADSL